MKQSNCPRCGKPWASCTCLQSPPAYDTFALFETAALVIVLAVLHWMG